jgi:hypothetical protein
VIRSPEADLPQALTSPALQVLCLILPLATDQMQAPAVCAPHLYILF